jgi:hypothetical protein
MFKIVAFTFLLFAESALAFNKPTAFATKPPFKTAGSKGVLWRPPINTHMVAGGAERAYGDEYYEGELMSAVFVVVLNFIFA